MLSSRYEGSFIFPVIFSDGMTETAIGDVVVFPSTRFQDFRLTLSQQIGILPSQFSVYLTSQRRPEVMTLVNLKSDFSKICAKKDSSFLVVLKQRTARSPIKSQNQLLNHWNEQAGNFTLMKRDAGVVEGYKEFERRVRDLQISKDNFLVSLGMADSKVSKERKALVCEECEKAKGTGQEMGFHHCVNDLVTFEFRSAAGAVGRPAKKQPR